MAMRKLIQLPKAFASHPLGRGMISYSLTFPTACFIQQYSDKKRLENVSWKKCLRFSVYGVLVAAPMIFGWVKIANRIWPHQGLSAAVQKAVLEQATYAPTAISLFFFSMGLLDNEFDVDAAIGHVKQKFWNSYKIGLCYWPIVQTINFTFVPSKNRIVFISLCSLLWVTFLASVDAYESPMKPKFGELEVTKLNKH